MIEKFGIKNRSAIVTGGGQGIGRAIATIFVEAGARVLIADKIAETVEATAQELSRQGGNVLATVTDVRDAGQVAEMVNTAQKAFGPIDILVNNAAGNFKASFLDLSEKGWDAVVRATLKSVFLCSQAAAKVMVGQNSGNIINVTSMDAFRGTEGAAAYGASKAGVVSLTKTLALELAPYHIRVNSIAPGHIDTPGTSQWRPPEVEQQLRESIPLGRLGQSEDIATVALFLASEASAYMTGETILVDGGLLLSRP